MNKTFWVVEDGDEMLQILTTYLIQFLPTNFTIKTVNSCLHVNANPNDIILCDQHGVDFESLNSNGARIITMSGDTSLVVDLYKPFTGKQFAQCINHKSKFAA